VLLALLVALTATLTFSAAPASAATRSQIRASTGTGVQLNAVESRLVMRINAARKARGIAPLTVAAGFTDVARRWSAVQLKSNTMKHNPNYAAQLQASGGTGWRSLAENVGYCNSDADRLFDAYMNSPHHKANILNPAFRYIGMGWVARADGVGYNTQNFSTHYSPTYGPTRVSAYARR
jgi:uncharacterized protein YkwD